MPLLKSNKEKLRSEVKGEILFDEPLSKYTTVKIGGPAEALFYPLDLDDLAKAVAFCKAQDLSYFVIGNGSNLLIRDGGIRGVVIKLTRCLKDFRVEKEEGNEVLLGVDAGYSLPKLVEYTKQQGLSGIESLFGVPGSVGGAIIMNAGTREGEIGESIEELTVMDHSGQIKIYPKSRLNFEYRDLKIPRTEIAIRILLRLKRSKPERVAEKIEFFQKRRFDTQPLDQPNMGSVFKNPPKKFAAQMIEELGLKGIRVGGARLSEKHSNWIVNEGGATAKDVLALIGLIRDKVKEATGIRLETEVKVVGEE